MVGAGGLVVSIIAFAVGAILDWAVTVQNQHGVNVNKVGWILMVVGVVGAVVSIIVMVAGNTVASGQWLTTAREMSCVGLTRRTRYETNLGA